MHSPSPSIDELITYATLWQGGDRCHALFGHVMRWHVWYFTQSFRNASPTISTRIYSATPCPFNLSLHHSYPRDHQEIFSTSRQLPSRLILKDDEWGQINMSTLNVQGLHTLVKQAFLAAGMMIAAHRHRLTGCPCFLHSRLYTVYQPATCIIFTDLCYDDKRCREASLCNTVLHYKGQTQ